MTGAVSSSGKPPSASRQGDTLLWAGGVAIALLGGAWLAVMQPWSGAELEPLSATGTAARPAARNAPAPAEPLGAPLDNPLRMAQLALEAGMLIEPEEYSAWALFQAVLQDEPDNAAAASGLQQVADALVSRARAALEQGRVADARAIVERILDVLPGHEGAVALGMGFATLAPNAPAEPPGGEQVAAVPTPSPAAAPAPVPEAEAPTPAPTAEATPVARAPARAPAPPRPELLSRAFEDFQAALAANRLLTPEETSAKHFAAALAELDANHEYTRAATAELFRVFLTRATQALDTLDTAAASAWIDEAQLLGVDAEAVARARTAVVDRLAAMEGARPLPASALAILDYVAPVYPERALLRGLEGWVDIEFTVATDGTTKDITITGASHDTTFRREAAAAVEQWRFEPRSFMGRLIDQRSYTRIRFVQ